MRSLAASLLEDSGVEVELTRAQAVELSKGMGEVLDQRLGRALVKKGLVKAEQVRAVTKKPGFMQHGINYSFTDLGYAVSKSLSQMAKIPDSGVRLLVYKDGTVNVITESVVPVEDAEELIDALRSTLSGRFQSEIAKGIYRALGQEAVKKLIEYWE